MLKLVYLYRETKLFQHCRRKKSLSSSNEILFLLFLRFSSLYDAIEGEKEQKEKINESMRTNNNI